MEKYDPGKIEKKWTKYWIDNKTFVPDLEKSKKPYYALFMFPYPSAEGLHIGNFYAFASVDVMAKYMRLRGFDVYEPVGWDAFGIHSENYALKIGETPKKMLERTIGNFRHQLQASGLSCDWTREINTTDPEYYRWTQWIFTKLFEKGLAYQKEALVNWCPDCKTVLADEQIEAEGLCERCKTVVEKRNMKQWFFKITHYAERLLDGLEEMDWSEITKSAQRNWIGRSEGATIKFKVSEKYFFEVFTTRLDTIFGCTYCVVAPEHELVGKLKSKIENFEEVEEYVKQAEKKSEIERMELTKEKTGIELKGIKATNPFTEEEVPIYVADYVLGHYGTGAVMAVPAHDERDFEFAKKYDLPVRQAIAPLFIGEGDDVPIESEPRNERNVVTVIVKHWEGDKFLCLDWENFGWKSFVIGGIEKDEDAEQAAARELGEETGYTDIKTIRKIDGEIHDNFNARHKKIGNRYIKAQCFLVELKSARQSKTSDKDTKHHKYVWLEKKDVEKSLNIGIFREYWKYFLEGEKATVEDGVLIGSAEYSGLTSEQAREKMAEWLEEKKLGGKKTTYRLHDWVISRQRYWGPPIPVIYCDKCGAVAVPEKDLPVRLPELEKGWEPAGDGRGPLAKVESFINTTCPQCGGPARRESDVMDNFLDSAWYFFRYVSPRDDKEIFDGKLGKKWLPVDLYVGGNEHAVLHLMYTRFITMVLHDLGLTDFDNPFKKFRANGMILKDGKKMSKSKGNVVNPEEYGEKLGYDALKSYLLFLGPLSEDRSFSDEGIRGLRHWAERVFNLVPRVRQGFEDSEEISRKLHQTIKAVGDDMEKQKYNTAIAKLMELTNTFYGAEKISKDNFEKFITTVSIFLPALAEELWSSFAEASEDKEKHKYSESIFLQSWPEYDPELIKDGEITLIVQINGKVRDQMKVPAGVKEEEARKLALSRDKVIKYIEGKDIKKVVYVPDKLVNFVI